MITPPLTIERVLEGLSAKTAFRDGIIGDLAEEFTHRVERDGRASARRWYYREAVRVTPHLLRDWARNLNAHSAFHLALFTAASYLFMWVLAFAVIRTEQAVMRALGLPIGLILNGTVNALIGLVSGAFAARISKDTPLLCAIGVGLSFVATVALSSLVLASGPPMRYRVLWAVIVLVGTTVGGTLRVRAVGLSRAPS